MIRRQLSPFLRSSTAERSRNVPVSVSGLDWQEFSAAHFPARRRHDMAALTAYGADKRVQLADEPTTEETRLALGAWEDEGGAAV